MSMIFMLSELLIPFEPLDPLELEPGNAVVVAGFCGLAEALLKVGLVCFLKEV